MRVKKRSLCSQVSYAFVTMPEGGRERGREGAWEGEWVGWWVGGAVVLVLGEFDGSRPC